MDANTDVLKLWSEYSRQLQQVIKVNQQQAITILQLKLSTNLKKLRPVKWLGVFGGIIWIGIGVVVLNYVIRSAREAGEPINYYFFLSFALQLVITAWATVLYLYHLRLIHQVQLDTPVVQTQRLLNQLQVSQLWVPRILLLQLPLWTTFYLRPEMIASFSILGWTLQLLSMGVFIYASWWFFTHIRLENIHKKWFHSFFGSSEWPVLERASAHLKSIEQLQIEENTIEN